MPRNYGTESKIRALKNADAGDIDALIKFSKA